MISSNILDVDDRPIGRIVNHEGFAAISKLEKLEYLFLPGYLLSRHTIETIESLPELKELHAVFSYVRRALLDRITQLDNLEALSIGVSVVDGNLVQKLSNLRKLRTLQLVVFNSQLLQTTALQKRAESQLKRGLPNCTVHLIFLDDLHF